MIKKVFGCLVVFVFLMSAISVFIPEVSAALPQCNHMGTVISKDTWNNTITIQTDYEYKEWISKWTLYRCALEGAAPNENALNEINVGDYVEAYSLGAPGGNWVTLAKIKSIAEHEVITDIYGDSAGTLFYSYQGGRHYPPLLGDYMITYKNTPNCSRCYGCNCEALYTIVNLSKGSNQIASKLLYPGQKCAYQGEIYCINITFLSGQAYAYPECTDEQGCCGPKAISDFVIHITTPTVKKPFHNLNTGESFSAYIQAAIDDPDTKEGHTIAVDPGTYWQNVKVTKSLTITSTSGNPADTIVRVPHSDDPAFKVTANYVKIHGFTVKGVADEWLPPPPDEDPWPLWYSSYPDPHFEKTGIYIDCADYCSISNNTCLDNENGIFIEDSNSNCIYNNILNNEDGIYKRGGIQLRYSNNNRIYNNICSNNEMGILLCDSNNNSISNNNCSQNLCGIRLGCSGNYYGYLLNGSDLWESNNNSITNNTCMNNNCGISILSHSLHNTIYHNCLMNNTNQAFDSRCTNYWNSSYPSGGNYWSDYRQKYIEEYNKDPEDKQCGLNQDNECECDGIWDTPYTWIGGGTGAKDRYPLVRPLWNVG